MRKLDLTGQVFGHLTALHETEMPGHRQGDHMTWWACLCVCGGTYITTTSQLRSGSTTSCGCTSPTTARGGRPRLDLAGQRYGRLTVEGELLPRTPSGHWICRCDCGQGKHVSFQSLRRSMVKSCGCLVKWRNTQRRAAMDHANKHAAQPLHYKGIPAHWWVEFVDWTVDHSIALHLTVNQAWDLFQGQIAMCNLTAEPLNFRSEYAESAPALIRRKPEIGYTPENSHWVSKPLVQLILARDVQEHVRPLKYQELVEVVASDEKKVT